MSVSEPAHYYQDESCVIYHGDCREIAPRLVPIASDPVVIADPPYGAGYDTTRSRGRMYGDRDWPALHGEDEAFDPTWLLKYRRVVLFGANHYANKLPASSSWIVWDKREGHGQNDFADCELVWSNLGGPARLFHHYWMGGITKTERTRKLHPTQKPVALMAWLLTRPAASSGTVLDPYMGSGPVLRAAKDLGRHAIGIEIEERYCEIAARRLGQEVLPLEAS